jgi:hypothetical protein
MSLIQIKLTLYIILLSAVCFKADAQQVPFPQGYGSGLCGCDTTAVIDSSGTITPGKIILETGMKMAVVMKNIVQGSCWDFVNEVFNRSEVAGNKKVVYKSKKSGPYAQADAVQPGDWIYHVNHQFNNIEHSAIFVCWKDVKRRIAITLSYAGMNKKVPAKYGEYNISSIYAIFRPQLPLQLQPKAPSIEVPKPALTETKAGGKP